MVVTMVLILFLIQSHQLAVVMAVVIITKQTHLVALVVEVHIKLVVVLVEHLVKDTMVVKELLVEAVAAAVLALLVATHHQTELAETVVMDFHQI